MAVKQFSADFSIGLPTCFISIQDARLSRVLGISSNSNPFSPDAMSSKYFLSMQKERDCETPVAANTFAEGSRVESCIFAILVNQNSSLSEVLFVFVEHFSYYIPDGTLYFLITRNCFIYAILNIRSNIIPFIRYSFKDFTSFF